jgi:DNA polymerase-3 subunit beta
MGAIQHFHDGRTVKFQVNRDVFSEAVSFAVKLLPQRTTLPILSGVLIHAEGDGLVLSSFDYEVSSRTEIQADVEQPGTVLVSGRLLAEIAGRLPNAPVRVSTEESRISVACGSASFTLLSMPVEEYPSIPEIGEQTGVVPAEEFASAVSQVAVAASRDDVTPVITGVQLEVRATNLSLVATDRYRVAIREIEWDGGGVAGADDATTTALVPARTLQEVGKTFGHSGNISVAITSRDDRELIAFSADRKTVTSLLIKGNFPPVRRLFPDTVENYAVMNTADLIEATRRVALVLEREAALRYSFSADGLTLEAIGSEQTRRRPRPASRVPGSRDPPRGGSASEAPAREARELLRVLFSLGAGYLGRRVGLGILGVLDRRPLALRHRLRRAGVFRGAPAGGGGGVLGHLGSRLLSRLAAALTGAPLGQHLGPLRLRGVHVLLAQHHLGVSALPGLADERLHGAAGLGALADPVVDPCEVEHQPGGVRQRLEEAQGLDEPSVPGVLALGDHDAVVRLLLPAHPPESNADGHGFPRLCAASGPVRARGAERFRRGTCPRASSLRASSPSSAS